jgi:hypothetical protein
MTKLQEILEELSCPECKAFYGEKEYRELIALALSAIEGLVPSEKEIMRILQISILPTAIARDDASKIFKDGVNVKTLAHSISALLKERLGG